MSKSNNLSCILLGLGMGLALYTVVPAEAEPYIGSPSLSKAVEQKEPSLALVNPSTLEVKPKAESKVKTVVKPAIKTNQDTAFYYPLPEVVPVSSPYGWRVHPITGEHRLHSGTDLAAPMGAPVEAAHFGTVIFAGNKGGYGKTVIIAYKDGQYATLYGHLSELLVKEGQKVIAKQLIGKVGSTGASTGPHLHFELRKWVANRFKPVSANRQLKAVEAYAQAKPLVN